MDSSRSPPLQYPSKYYMSRHGPENDGRSDYNNEAIPPSSHSSADYHSGDDVEL